MNFKGAHFSIETGAKLAKKNIVVLNNIIGITYRMNDFNYNILLEIIGEDEGVEVSELRTFNANGKRPFQCADVKHDGKSIGTIFLNFEVEETVVEA